MRPLNQNALLHLEIWKHLQENWHSAGKLSLDKIVLDLQWERNEEKQTKSQHREKRRRDEHDTLFMKVQLLKQKITHTWAMESATAELDD